VRVADRVRGARGDHRLADETGRVDEDVGGDDDRVGLLDGLLRQRLLCPVRALRLHLDDVAHDVRLALERFRGHERVRDARRARGDGHEPHRCLLT
jgi:hypothetical protein